MNPLASIFLEFNLPNASTWFYFSALMAVALFFKFSRILSVRNWDILTLFLLVPGFLLIQESQLPAPAAVRTANLDTPSFLSSAALNEAAADASGRPLTSGSGTATAQRNSRLMWSGYLWLICGSAIYLVRCLADLALIRRPALSPNLNLAGLAWLGTALFVCLSAVAVRRPADIPDTVGKQSVAVNQIQKRAEDGIKQGSQTSKEQEPRIEFWVERVSAMLCHLSIAVALCLIGWRHFQDTHAGVAMATLYLLLPYTAYHVNQVHHVLPTSLVIWAVAAYRYPTLSGSLLGLATGTGYFPVLLVPAWLSFYWRRGIGRFSAAFLLACGLCLAVIASILWFEGDLAASIRTALDLADWQPWQQPDPKTTSGLWIGIHWAYRLPIFIAYLIAVAITSFWPRPKNLAHLMALSTAVIIGIQFWYGDQGGVYVLWYLPLLLLVVFRPNLSDREAAAIDPASDWLARILRRVKLTLSGWLGLLHPSVHAP